MKKHGQLITLTEKDKQDLLNSPLEYKQTNSGLQAIIKGSEWKSEKQYKTSTHGFLPKTTNYSDYEFLTKKAFRIIGINKNGEEKIEYFGFIYLNNNKRIEIFDNVNIIDFYNKALNEIANGGLTARNYREIRHISLVIKRAKQIENKIDDLTDLLDWRLSYDSLLSQFKHFDNRLKKDLNIYRLEAKKATDAYKTIAKQDISGVISWDDPIFTEYFDKLIKGEEVEVVEKGMFGDNILYKNKLKPFQTKAQIRLNNELQLGPGKRTFNQTQRDIKRVEKNQKINKQNRIFTAFEVKTGIENVLEYEKLKRINELFYDYLVEIYYTPAHIRQELARYRKGEYQQAKQEEIDKKYIIKQEEIEKKKQSQFEDYQIDYRAFEEEDLIKKEGLLKKQYTEELAKIKARNDKIIAKKPKKNSVLSLMFDIRKLAPQKAFVFIGGGINKASELLSDLLFLDGGFNEEFIDDLWTILSTFTSLYTTPRKVKSELISWKFHQGSVFFKGKNVDYNRFGFFGGRTDLSLEENYKLFKAEMKREGASREYIEYRASMLPFYNLYLKDKGGNQTIGEKAFGLAKNFAEYTKGAVDTLGTLALTTYGLATLGTKSVKFLGGNALKLLKKNKAVAPLAIAIGAYNLLDGEEAKADELYPKANENKKFEKYKSILTKKKYIVVVKTTSELFNSYNRRFEVII